MAQPRGGLLGSHLALVYPLYRPTLFRAQESSMFARKAMRCAAIVLVVGVVSLGRPIAQKSPHRGDPSKAHRGLHAGIRAQIIPSYTETPNVMLSFVLLNDSETPVDVEAG